MGKAVTKRTKKKSKAVSAKVKEMPNNCANNCASDCFGSATKFPYTVEQCKEDSCLDPCPISTETRMIPFKLNSLERARDLKLFAEDALMIIKEAPMLPTESITELEKRSGTIQKAFETKQVHRTEVEARVSVLNDLKFPTDSAKYWQATREEDVHFTELVRMSFEYRRVQLDIEELEERLEEEGLTDLEKRRVAIDIEEKAFMIKQMQLSAKHRYREIMQWERIREELIDANPGINTEDPNDHQMRSYCIRFTNQLLTAMRTKNNSPSEMINIEGLFRTAINRIGKDAYIREILPLYNNVDQKFLMQSLR